MHARLWPSSLEPGKGKGEFADFSLKHGPKEFRGATNIVAWMPYEFEGQCLEAILVHGNGGR
jgi:hypothetical protein